MVHLPALNVKFPANAFLVVEDILVVATFDVPYINMDDMLFGTFEVSESDGIFIELANENA